MQMDELTKVLSKLADRVSPAGQGAESVTTGPTLASAVSRIEAPFEAASGSPADTRSPSAGLASATQASSPNGSEQRGLQDAVALLAVNIEQLRQATSSQVDILEKNTDAVLQSAVSRVTQGATAGGIASGLFGGVLRNAFGLGSIVSGIAGLFGGGEKKEEVPLERFVLPSAVNVDAGLTSARQFSEIRYAQDSLPRSTTSSAQPIQINIQALDSKSFMDHSEDIARAVKDAMLHSHSINDVVSDL